MPHFKRHSRHRDASVDSMTTSTSEAQTEYDQSASRKDHHSLKGVSNLPSYMDADMRDAPRSHQDDCKQQSASPTSSPRKKRAGNRGRRRHQSPPGPKQPHHRHDDQWKKWPPRTPRQQDGDLRQLITRQHPQRRQQQQQRKGTPFSGVQDAVGTLMEDMIGKAIIAHVRNQGDYRYHLHRHDNHQRHHRRR